MFGEYFLRKNNELNSDEYLMTIKNQSEFTNEFNKYILDLKKQNKIIDYELAGEMFIYQHLQLDLNKDNLVKIKDKLEKIKSYIDRFEDNLKGE